MATKLRSHLSSIALIFGLLLPSFDTNAQWWKKADEAEKERSKGMLLLTTEVQTEATVAINQMYNFHFPEAEREFNYLKVKYPQHPLPDFLLGLMQWWKIVPNTKNEVYDDRLIEYMDQSIDKAEKIYDETENPEAAFFMAAAYAFKGRLHAERKHWTRATLAAKSALKYLEYSRNFADFSPELMFGDGLYNYYYFFIKQNFPLLRPVLWLFPKADKSQGIAQLEKVSYQAFYTRTEARYFLLQIYGIENMNEKAYGMAKYTSETFPDNPYFHRYYARAAFLSGNMEEATSLAKEILRRLDQHQVGYEATSGRYASYILGYYALYVYRNQSEATNYFKQCMAFSTSTDAMDSGYYWASLLGLARISYQQQNYDQAVDYCKQVLEHAEKKSAQYTEAKKLLSESKKARRKKK